MIQFQYSPDGLVQPPTRLTLISDSGDGRFFWDSRNSDPFLISRKGGIFPKNLQKGRGEFRSVVGVFFKFVDGVGPRRMVNLLFVSVGVNKGNLESKL